LPELSSEGVLVSPLDSDAVDADALESDVDDADPAVSVESLDASGPVAFLA
jgi:hypothetical protein